MTKAPPTNVPKKERIAKVMARAGLCSRREAERWITEGRVSVDGKVLETPAFSVDQKNLIQVDGKTLDHAEETRLWRYHKPKDLIVSHKDPQGRPCVFDHLPKSLPRVISVGRLDINSEGLLLLTNDGELARELELPSRGWKRRYRVRVYGEIAEDALKRLEDGIEYEGVRFGPIQAQVERQQRTNSWLSVSLHEGKNREVRKAMEFLKLSVSRLIRVSYGPFQLGHMKSGALDEVPSQTLREQLGQAFKRRPEQRRKHRA
jgi:23S rRNA pseudouridine2605 synthase